MSARLSGSPESVLQAVRGHLRRRGGVLAAIAGVGVVAAVLLVAWIVGGEGWTPGSLLPVALLVLGAGVAAALWVALLRYLGRWGEEPRLAGEIERTAGLSPGAFRAQIELGRSTPDGVSSSLVRAGAAGIMPRLGGGETLAGRPGRELGRVLRVSAVLAGSLSALLLVLTLVAPERSRVAWSGLANPGEVIAAGALPPLEIRPGDTTLPRGSRPRIQVTAGGREEVTLHWQAVGEPLESRPVPVAGGIADSRLPPLEAEVRYWASALDGARTEEARLTPSDPLLLSDVTVELEYPAYTGLPTESLRGPPPELSVPEGTTIAIRGRIEGEEAGQLGLAREEDGERLLEFELNGRDFEGVWRPTASTTAVWEASGGDGERSLPDPIRLTVKPDRAPSLDLPVPGGDGELPASFRLPLLVEASDDYGLDWIEIVAVRVRRDGSREEPVADRIPAEGRRDVSLRPVLDLVDWNLRPGEEVHLSARAADRAPVARTTETATYRLRVPSAREMRDAARERIEGTGNRLGSLQERAEQEARRLQEMEREARMGSSRSSGSEYQSREDLREAARSQGELTDELDELRQELEEAERSLAGLEEDDRGLRERMRELGRLVSELADPGERARMEELMQRLADGEAADSARELEEMARAREELAERMEEVLERVRREALEERFSGSEEELEALAEAQDAVSERLDTEEGRAVQDSLAGAAEEAGERLDELSRRLDEQGDSAAARATEGVEGELDRAREAMQRAAEAAGAQDASTASEQADEATTRAQEALAAMQQARREWMEEWAEEMRDALRTAAEDALSLAREQGALGERVSGASARERGELQGEESVLGDGIRNLATRLTIETRQAAEAARPVTEALGEALGAAEETAAALERPLAAATRAEDASNRVVEALNRAAALALGGMDQVGESGDGAMQEMMEALEELAGKQEEINEQSQSMMNNLEMEGAASQLEELAASQDAMSGAMEEMAQNAGGESMSGNLEEMAEEAGELAEEMREGRLDGETLTRQEELLERLLDAGRTLERDGPTDEREGRTAENVERRVVEPIPAGVLGGVAIPLPGPEELARLTPAERQLVLEYFERLNRGARGGGGG